MSTWSIKAQCSSVARTKSERQVASQGTQHGQAPPKSTQQRRCDTNADLRYAKWGAVAGTTCGDVPQTLLQANGVSETDVAFRWTSIAWSNCRNGVAGCCCSFTRSGQSCVNRPCEDGSRGMPSLLGEAVSEVKQSQSRSDCTAADLPTSS